MAQRLARRLCKHCREPYQADDSTCDFMGLPRGSMLYKGRGCLECAGKGLKGRVGIHEVLKMNPELRQLVARGASTDEIHALAIRCGMLDLKSYAGVLLLKGDTSVEEVLQVVSVQE
jgi:type II secretory ATPase GspE/PulE/Tfp pilus assembly ATPase PilB-like protein